MDKPMSNKDTAIYMIPAGCTLTALLVAESCYDNGMLWLPIMLLASAGIVIFVKKKTSARRQAKADVATYKSRAYCSTERSVIQ